MEVTFRPPSSRPKSPDPLYAVWSGWAPLIYGTAPSGRVVKLVKFPAFRPYTRARVPARLRRKRIEVHQLHHVAPAGLLARMRHAATSTPCRAMTRSPGREGQASTGPGIVEIAGLAISRHAGARRPRTVRQRPMEQPGPTHDQPTQAAASRQKSAAIRSTTQRKPLSAARQNVESYESRRRC
jgi:hypothetical protein